MWLKIIYTPSRIPGNCKIRCSSISGVFEYCDLRAINGRWEPEPWSTLGSPGSQRLSDGLACLVTRSTIAELNEIPHQAQTNHWILVSGIECECSESPLPHTITSKAGGVQVRAARLHTRKNRCGFAIILSTYFTTARHFVHDVQSYKRAPTPPVSNRTTPPTVNNMTQAPTAAPPHWQSQPCRTSA